MISGIHGIKEEKETIAKIARQPDLAVFIKERTKNSLLNDKSS
jgi:hypothetical protein